MLMLIKSVLIILNDIDLPWNIFVSDINLVFVGQQTVHLAFWPFIGSDTAAMVNTDIALCSSCVM